MQDGNQDPPSVTPNPSSDEADLIGLRAAAERLDVHYMTAYRYVRLGTLPATKVGGEWRVKVADLARVTQQDEPRPGPGGLRWPKYRTQLGDRLIAGDEAGAWSVVERALASGATARDIHLELIAPALRTIGEKWTHGDLDVADEHRASSVAGRLIARLGPSFARRGRKRGVVVVGAAAGDHHSIPVSILADILRGEGLEVIDLGANTPPESFVRTALDRDDVVAVAISVGSDVSLPSARQAAAHVHRYGPGIPVFVGGPAVLTEEDARGLGADEYGTSALDVALRCLELARGE